MTRGEQITRGESGTEIKQDNITEQFFGHIASIIELVQQTENQPNNVSESDLRDIALKLKYAAKRIEELHKEK